MKRFAMILCLMGALLGQKGFANYFGSGCNGCSDLSFSVYADYLYWEVTTPENPLFGYSVGANTHLTPLRAKYSSGYRVGGAIYYNNVDFGVRYTSLHNHTNLIAPNVNLATILDYELNYQTVDLTFGYTHYFQCHRGYLKPYIGAKLAWLKENLTNSTSPVTSSSLFTNTVHAYGPMIGIEGNWELFRCCLPVSLIARGDISVLRSSFAFTEPTVIFDFNSTSFVAVSDLFIGLGFDICNFSCFDANFQVGYESQSWNGFLGNPAFPVPSNTLGLGGFVGRFGVMF